MGEKVITLKEAEKILTDSEKNKRALILTTRYGTAFVSYQLGELVRASGGNYTYKTHDMTYHVTRPSQYKEIYKIEGELIVGIPLGGMQGNTQLGFHLTLVEGEPGLLPTEMIPSLAMQIQ